MRPLSLGGDGVRLCVPLLWGWGCPMAWRGIHLPMAPLWWGTRHGRGSLPLPLHTSMVSSRGLAPPCPLPLPPPRHPHRGAGGSSCSHDRCWHGTGGDEDPRVEGCVASPGVGDHGGLRGLRMRCLWGHLPLGTGGGHCDIMALVSAQPKSCHGGGGRPAGRWAPSRAGGTHGAGGARGATGASGLRGLSRAVGAAGAWGSPRRSPTPHQRHVVTGPVTPHGQCHPGDPMPGGVPRHHIPDTSPSGLCSAVAMPRPLSLSPSPGPPAAGERRWQHLCRPGGSCLPAALPRAPRTV